MYQLQVSRAKLESFRFKAKDDYGNEIFPILSSARVGTNAILAGKCGSRRRSTTSFSENDGENKLSNVRNLII